MATREPLPEPWRSALEPKGVTSKRGLATKIGVSPQTAKRLIDGIGRPSAETVALVADVFFAGDRDIVWELTRSPVRDHGDWILPPEASLLDEEQRAAVLAVVRAMLPAEARHLTKQAEDKQARRAETEPDAGDVMEAQRAHLQAVADDETANDDLDQLDDERDDPPPVRGAHELPSAARRTTDQP